METVKHAFNHHHEVVVYQTSIMTLLIQVPTVVLKVYALAIWSRNELPVEIIGSLREIDETSVNDHLNGVDTNMANLSNS